MFVPPSNQNKKPLCYRCNKLGHIAKYCKLNKKLRNLELNEGILSQISNLLAEISFNEEKASIEVELENNQIIQQDDCCFESSKTQSLEKEVNVFTKEQGSSF